MWSAVAEIAKAAKRRLVVREPIFSASFTCGMGTRATFAIGMIGLLLSFAATDTLAGAFSSTTHTLIFESCNGVKITGRAGESFTITYTDMAGKEQTETVKLGGEALSQNTKSFCVAAKTKTTITVKNKTQPDEEAQELTALASLDPPSTKTVVAILIDPSGSVVTLGGNIFTLGGGFTAVADHVDYDRSSSTYGTLGGLIPDSDFNVMGSGAAGTFHIALSADTPWMVNVGALWEAAEVPSSGVSVPFILDLIGTLDFNSISSQLVGTLTGTVTFFDNDQASISGNLDLLSDFGSIGGTFASSGQARLVPEPPTPLLVIVASVGLMWLRTLRRRVRRATEPKYLRLGPHE